MSNIVSQQDIMKAIDRTNECMRLLMKRGLSEKDKQRVIDDPEFRSELIEFWKQDSYKSLNFIVNYDQLIEDLVEAGSYDYANPNVNSENFGDELEGKEDIELFLLSSEDLFGEERSASTDEVLQAMKEKGFKPAGEVHGARAVLTFGSKHPDEQRRGSIVDLGSTWRSPDGYRGVPGLWSDGSVRDLVLDWVDVGWSSGCRFAAVRT